MRGGRNKFGPIYRRDRALRRQLHSQLKHDTDFEAVAKAAATATIARADLDAIATVTVDELKSCSAQDLHLDVDVKPDVAELCEPMSQGNTTNCAGPTSSAATSPMQSSYLSVAANHNAASSLSTASDPISGLSGMAAALLSQFLQQQQQQRHFVPTRTTSASAGDPRVVTPSLTTTVQNVVVSSQVISSIQPPQGGALAPPASATQYFTSRPSNSPHPVTPQRYVIPVIRNLSPSTPRQPLYPAIHTVSHSVTPQQSVISVDYVASPQQAVISTDHTMSHPITPRQSILPVVHAVSHPVTPNQPVTTVQVSIPQQSIIPTVRITPDVSESAVSASDISRIRRIPPPAPAPPSSSCTDGELQWSSQELPATLQLIFDLKRETSSSGRSTDGGSDQLRTFAEHLLQQPVTSSVTSSLESAIQRAVALACRVCDRQLFLLVDWARQAHFFRHLAVSLPSCHF